MSPYRTHPSDAPKQTYASESFIYEAEMAIALIHSASPKRSRVRLAIESLHRCVLAGIRMRNPRLTYNARELLAIVSV